MGNITELRGAAILGCATRRVASCVFIVPATAAKEETDSVAPAPAPAASERNRNWAADRGPQDGVSLRRPKNFRPPASLRALVAPLGRISHTIASGLSGPGPGPLFANLGKTDPVAIPNAVASNRLRRKTTQTQRTYAQIQLSRSPRSAATGTPIIPLK